MKNLILAAVMALGFTSVAAASPVEDCIQVAEAVALIREAPALPDRHCRGWPRHR